MKITTKYLGKLAVDQANIITFPTGIPGFIDETEFVLLNLPGELSTAFQVLQSIKTSELAFIVTNPYLFYNDYEFKLEDAIVEQLKISHEKDIVILSIVTLKNPFSESTINLKAPLIINNEKRLGKQYILNIDTYEPRTPLSVPNQGEDH